MQARKGYGRVWWRLQSALLTQFHDDATADYPNTLREC